MTSSHTPQSSPWDAFRHPTYLVLWIATVIANVGTWMYNAAAGWLMLTLDADPLIVSLVQVATTLPVFLFALPAGALADILDKRRFLIGVEIAVTLVATAIGALVWLNLITPALLLGMTFLLGIGAAFTAPAWQAIVPQLVPHADLPAAVAANSVGINISRAIGPALGGLIIGAFGIAVPFWLNAATNLGIIGALTWWRTPQSKTASLPAERFVGAMIVGFRHARNSQPLRATLVRAIGFFLFASAYWALLPLMARAQISASAAMYGILLGAIGVGAVCGAFILPLLKKHLGPDRTVALGTLGTAISLVLFGLAQEPVIALAASGIAGVSWIVVLATLNVSAQLSLPDWVRGRGLSVFVTVFFGAMTAGSAIWGQVATMFGLPAAHFCASAAALLAIPITWPWKLQSGAEVDLTPSMYWPAPIVAHEVEHDRGPVLVAVEYRIDPRNRDAFLVALDELAHARRRDGAYAWDIFEDAAVEGRYMETFMTASWLEHLRQHQRVTNADRTMQTGVRHFHLDGEPQVTHFVAARVRRG